MRSYPTDRAVDSTLTALGNHLRNWRRLHALTQQQVADRAGISRGVVVRLERGDGGVSLELWVRVLRALNLHESVGQALDPLTTDLGRARAGQALPIRVSRPRRPGGARG